MHDQEENHPAPYPIMQVRERLAEAERSLADSRYNDALRHCAIAKWQVVPKEDYADYYVYKSAVYAKEGQVFAAMAMGERNSPEKALGYYHQAIASFRKSLNYHMSPGQLRAFEMCLRSYRNYIKTKDIFIAEGKTLDADIENISGKYQYLMGNVTDALKHFNAAEKLHPSQENTFFMGLCYYSRKNYPKAKECFLKSQDYQANAREVACMAATLSHTKDHMGTLEMLLKTEHVAVTPGEKATFRYIMGNTAKNLGQIPRAKGYYSSIGNLSVWEGSVEYPYLQLLQKSAAIKAGSVITRQRTLAFRIPESIWQHGEIVQPQAISLSTPPDVESWVEKETKRRNEQEMPPPDETAMQRSAKKLQVHKPPAQVWAQAIQRVPIEQTGPSV